MFIGMAAVTAAAGGYFIACEILLFYPCSFITSAAGRVHTSSPPLLECRELPELNSETISIVITRSRNAIDWFSIY
jgi:hypothetical protein